MLEKDNVTKLKTELTLRFSNAELTGNLTYF